jgi:transcriptional regulator GlxA family with amidase domain
MRTIGIALFDAAEELDVVGPWEVLSSWARTFPEDDVQVLAVARSRASIRCAKGLQMVPDTDWAGAPALDVLVYPGGIGTRRDLADPAVLEWVRAIAARGALMASVCTGALVFAAAGLLRDRPATTHWRSLALLTELDGSIEIRPDDRFVDDGDVVTAAGVSAGIDMALHLVARLASPERARAIRRNIQYDPAPPV